MGWVQVWFPCAVAFLVTTTAGHQLELDPASRQLQDYAAHHKPKPLTVAAGSPVDITETNSPNDDLLLNQFYLDLQRSNLNERIPERVVHAKGTGATGYFEVTHDVTEFTKISMFDHIGKKTPFHVRFSSAIQNRGGDDLEREARGMAVKFYTDEGIWDVVTLHIPVFFFRDPIDFVHFGRAFRRNPQTDLFDNTMRYEFITKRPVITQSFFWLLSDYGIPRGYRKMDGFAQHTYRFYNKHGSEYYARINFRSDQGLANFTSQEAAQLKGIDADYFNRDLYNAIEKGQYPSWTMELDILLTEDFKNLDFDPFDLTALWPKGSYKTVPVGRLVVDRNVKNQFAEVEQSAYCPLHLVPGTTGPPDQIFRARSFSYPESLRHRLGINYQKIDINLPKYENTLNRDGAPPTRDNGRNAPNFYPTSYHGAEPTVDAAKPKGRVLPRASNAVDLRGANYFYNHILKTNAERQRLVENLAASLVTVTSPTKENAIELLMKVDHDLGYRVKEALPMAAAMRHRQLARFQVDGPYDLHREVQNWIAPLHHDKYEVSYYEED